MELKIRNQANEAFRALTTNESLPDRLKSARNAFIIVFGDKAPPKVMVALKAVEEIKDGECLLGQTEKIRQAIEAVIAAAAIDDVEPKPWHH